MNSKELNRWWTVVGGAICLSVGAGVISAFMFGTFIRAIAAQNHWGRSEVSLGLTIFEFAMGPGTIVLGSLVDRWGVRKPTLLFLTLFALSIALVSVMPPSVPLFCLAFVLVGFFAPGSNALPYAKVVCARFDRHRGLALGLTVGGTAVGGALMPQYAGYLLRNFGWRVGYLGVAVAVAAFSLPALYFLVKMPRDSQLTPRTRKNNADLPKLSQIARTSRSFRQLGLAIFCMSGVMLALLSQLVPMMMDRGATIRVATSMLSIAGLSSAVGRLLAGYLMDRVHAPYVAAVSFSITMIGVLILANGATGTSAMVAAGLIGVSIGAEADIITFIVSRYFDLRLFGRVCGGIWACWGWGAGIMIFLTGLCYDLLHSYHVALWAFVGLTAVSIVSICRLGPYVYPERRDVYAAYAPVPNDEAGVQEPVR
ncbi:MULTISPECIES: MFS transporter [Paraburkholderia]|uniref:Predicted arabinose efflux permease, MFS family n=1 Tax=Paraburkholderia phenazinium TaxID=60549 RepID=A0A1N6HG48_9BURK|nr:MFS transporter [Paraburkholderia phenazinium]SIO18707.1 Predicted arabinose efflux permease, MFS family [Paraburkholderia phenazinium]